MQDAGSTEDIRRSERNPTSARESRLSNPLDTVSLLDSSHVNLRTQLPSIQFKLVVFHNFLKLSLMLRYGCVAC